MKFSTFSIIAALFIANFSLAVGAPDCPEKNITVNSKVNYISKSCVANVYGITRADQYRSFTTNADGQFMVFEAFGHSGKNSTDTGSRTYYFFPVERRPSIDQNSSGQMIVRTASGPAVVLNPDGSIASMVGAKFTESKTISGSNKGGVEISYPNGILLDAGWAQGGQAIEKKDRSSTFTDPGGQKCTVVNSKLFTKQGYDYQFKYTTKHSLAVFLRSQCPSLDLSSLSRGSASDASDGGARLAPAN